MSESAFFWHCFTIFLSYSSIVNDNKDLNGIIKIKKCDLVWWLTTLSRGELTAATAPARRGIHWIILTILFFSQNGREIAWEYQVWSGSTMVMVALWGLSRDWGEIVGRRSGGGGRCNESPRSNGGMHPTSRATHNIHLHLELEYEDDYDDDEDDD